MATKALITSALGALLLFSGCGNSDENIPAPNNPEISQESAQGTPAEISQNNPPKGEKKRESKIVDRGFDIAKAVGEIQKTKDITTCDQLTSEEDKVECRDVFHTLHLSGTFSNENCLKISDDRKKTNCTEQFFTQKARDEKNPELCAQIPQEAKQNKCSDQFYREEATESKSVELCEKIQDETEKTMCSEQITQELKQVEEEKKRIEAQAEQAQAQADALELPPLDAAPEVSEAEPEAL